MYPSTKKIKDSTQVREYISGLEHLSQIKKWVMFTSADATAALKQLTLQLVDRNDQLSGFNDNPVVRSDYEADSPCPFLILFTTKEEANRFKLLATLIQLSL